MRFLLSKELHDLRARGKRSKLGKRLSLDVIRAFERRVRDVELVDSLRDLRNHKGLHIEKLEPLDRGICSMKVNDDLRLIWWVLEDDEGPYIWLEEIVNYHTAKGYAKKKGADR